MFAPREGMTVPQQEVPIASAVTAAREDIRDDPNQRRWNLLLTLGGVLSTVL